MSRMNLETVIEPASGGEAVAWFPAALDNITTHPSGRIWAGSVRNHLYLIRLEGERSGGDTRGRSRPPSHESLTPVRISSEVPIHDDR
jgi:hypothetical protein